MLNLKIIQNCFRTSGVSGNILINDVPRNKHDFRRKSSYITQDFAMMDKLTVLETLDFAADLKLSRKVSKSVKQKIVRIYYICTTLVKFHIKN